MVTLPQGGDNDEGDGDKICLGVITSPHGVRGMVRLKPFTEHPRDIASYGAVTLKDGRVFVLDVQGVSKGIALVKLDGVDMRDDAEALKGERIYITRAQLPKASMDEIYQEDLIGLDVHDPDKGHIGQVIAVLDFGAGELLEIQPHKGKSVVVPFGDNYPIRINDQGITLTIDDVWLN